MRSLMCCAALLAAGVGASGAGADGLPVLGVDAGGTGVVARSGDARYVTVPANGDSLTVHCPRPDSVRQDADSGQRDPPPDVVGVGGPA